MGLLHGPGPDVDVAQLVESAVERKRLGLAPGLHDDVVRLVVAVPQLRRVLTVGEDGVHRRADRETGDQPTAGHAVEHGEFLGDPCRRVVERERVAHHADRRLGRAPREGRCDQVRRRHEPVAVLVVLVAAHAVESGLAGELELVEVLVVVLVDTLCIQQPAVDVDPYGRMFVAEVVRQVLVGHEVKPEVLQRCPLHMSTA